MLYYEENGYVAFCVGLIEHHYEKHVWISFITGEWPGTGQEDCAVTCHVWGSEKGRIMKIEDGDTSPFEKEEVFDAYQVKRKEVLAVDGAKEWFIKTYLKLFEVDKETGSFLEKPINKSG